jgi:hypothetical protein
MTILIYKTEKSYLLILIKNDNHVSGELKPIAFDKNSRFQLMISKIPFLFSNPENKEKSKTVLKWT